LQTTSTAELHHTDTRLKASIHRHYLPPTNTILINTIYDIVKNKQNEKLERHSVERIHLPRPLVLQNCYSKQSPSITYPMSCVVTRPAYKPTVHLHLNCNHNPILTTTQLDLDNHQNLTCFLRGPCATFSPDFLKICRVVFFIILQTYI